MGDVEEGLEPEEYRYNGSPEAVLHLAGKEPNQHQGKQANDDGVEAIPGQVEVFGNAIGNP